MDWLRRIEALIRGPGPTMVFQPIVDLCTGETIGYEALSRFPERLPPELLDAGVADEAGLGLGPDVWFAQADLLGLGVDLEVSAILGALAHLDRLPAGCHMAVNVGPAALVSGAVAEAVRFRDLSRVVIEVTEHLAVTDYAALRDAVVRLQHDHSAGAAVRVPCMAADDVGAGSASLHHLLELAPVLSFAKVDRSLTLGVAADPVRQALLTGLVAMGAAAGFRVVAEGVETADQLATLRRLRVWAGQGWHLGRPGPLPATEATTVRG